MINGVQISIDNKGITLRGTLLGSTRPKIEDVESDNSLMLHSRSIYVAENISANGNNRFAMPVSFGMDKAIISVDGVVYYPNIDYVIKGNLVQWTSVTSTITPSSQVIAWGPANKYTAQAIEFLNVDMLSTLQYLDTGTQKYLLLDQFLESEKLPYSEKCIFLYINGSLYSPQVDFEFDVVNKRIRWLNYNNNILDIDSEVFICYINNVQTVPFKLGSKVVRNSLTVTSDHQPYFSIAAIPSDGFKSGSMLFYNTLQYPFDLEYRLNFPQLQIRNNTVLRDVIETGGKIDLFYIKDVDVFYNILLFNQDIIILNTPSNDGSIYQIPLNQPGMLPLANTKDFVFFRGLLATGKYFDNGTFENINNESLSGYVKPMYERSVSNIIWYSEARDPVIAPTVDVDNPHFFSYSGFLDSLSQNHSKKIYIQRDQTQTNAANFLINLPDLQGNNLTVFYNGEALFSQFGQFDINNKNLINFYIDAPVDGVHEIIVWYPINDAYSGIWFYDAIENHPGAVPGDELNFAEEISNISNSFLYINGVRIPPAHYRLHPNDKTKIILRSDVIGVENIPSGANIMLVHL